jgi:hypothetical protein
VIINQKRKGKKKGDHGNILGEVSGATKAMPLAAAIRCAPDLMMKFSSVQVSPDNQYKT